MASLKRNVKYFIRLALLLIVIFGFGIGLLWYLVSPAQEIRHILLISIDTCRADHLSCYGYELATTPNIDAVAAEGIVFENVIATVPLTLPSHSSMLTGTVPPYHGVHDNMGFRLPESNLTLAEILSANEFNTAGIISAVVLDSKYGISQGFDTYNDKFEEAHWAVDVSERKGSEATRFALERLEKQKEDKSFLFLHYYDPHYDYVPPEPFASQFPGNPYAGEIAYTDHCIGQVIGKLKELGIYDSTLIIITSDHGEMLGEHGEAGHGYFIYQSAVKVPLIFKLPGRSKAQRVSDIAGSIDIVPTICGMLGIEIPDPVQGKDLSPYFRGKKPGGAERHLYCESIYATQYDANPLLSVVSDRFKYIQTTRPELYDLNLDPAESKNLVEKQPHLARIMEDKLAQILEESVRKASPDSTMQMDAQMIKKLEGLGYVGISEKDFKFDQSKDDPKDLIDFHESTREGLILVNQRNFKKAIGALTRALELNPKRGEAYNNRGHAYIKVGEYDKAIRDLDRAIEMIPGDSTIYNNRGLAYLRKNDYDRAIRDLNRAIELDPKHVDAYDNRGTCYLGKENYKQALRDFDKVLKLTRALELNPKRGEAYNNRGLAYIKVGEYDKAIRDLDRAIEMIPGDSTIYNNRGLAYLRKNDYDRAIRDFDKVLKLDPDNANHKNIGYAMERLGRIREAISHYRQALSQRGDQPMVLNNLAWILATHEDAEIRDGVQAVRLAEQACELTGYKVSGILNTLAAAYAEMGQFDQAVETSQRTLQMAQKAGRIKSTEDIRARIEAYKAKRPHREN
jgi:arylsulfatase A-like enzyme/Flp pilus assembly protein TadD